MYLKSSHDVENFNNFVQKHLNLPADDECYKTVYGRPVPLIIVHALISLRSPAFDKPVRPAINIKKTEKNTSFKISHTSIL